MDERRVTTPSGERSPSPGWKRALRAAFVLAAVAGLVWLLDRIGWERIADYITRLGWTGGVVLVVLGNIENVFDAAAFRAAVSERVGLFTVLAINQAGGLLNRFIPWEAGEVLKGTLLSRHVSGRDAVAGTVIWNYVFRLTKPLTALFAALVGWALGPAGDHGVAGWMVLATLVSFLPYVGMRLLVHIGLGRIFMALLRVLRALRKDPEQMIADARALDETVRRFHRERPGDYARVLAYQIGARATSWLSLVAVLGFLAGYSPARASMVWAAVTVTSYLIALMPTRLGTTEAGSYAVFGLLGLEPALGLTAQVILTVKAVILNGLTALFAMGGGGEPGRQVDAVETDGAGGA